MSFLPTIPYLDINKLPKILSLPTFTLNDFYMKNTE